MSRHIPFLLLLLVLPLWLAASYGVRFALMEDGQWVGICVEHAARWECQARAGLGYLIHFRVIAWTALVLAVVGFIAPGKAGRVLAALALFFGIPALVLYSASLAVFALVLAGLRLVRAPRAA
ncbi:hypothetical protein [Aquipseudomonas alcaligenes]|uniref:Uncharacterized protein n=1 Tax=Aquipseudomonas alcaligenes TaxID=43263 RepID=A0A1N6S080_AQUAC|nr:hypothetical protein [Pseudomonas alcaligenes]SIQ34465.1 hypothetical protein SAMN05878282_103276 [Pseudomonas alcaligenes]